MQHQRRELFPTWKLVCIKWHSGKVLTVLPSNHFAAKALASTQSNDDSKCQNQPLKYLLVTRIEYKSCQMLLRGSIKNRMLLGTISKKKKGKKKEKKKEKLRAYHSTSSQPFVWL
jgi:hypothetical protein